MSSSNNHSDSANKLANQTKLVLAQMDNLPATTLMTDKVSYGESRLHEAQVVNGATYGELEYVFNEGYRQAKTNLSVIGYQLTLTLKEQRKVKSELLLDKYPEFLKENKMKDNASIRDAFLEKHAEYTKCQDRIDQINAIIALMEGKIKVFENTCRYMRKEMDILINSGMINNKFVK